MTQRKSVCQAHVVISAGGFPQTFVTIRILLINLPGIASGGFEMFFCFLLKRIKMFN